MINSLAMLALLSDPGTFFMLVLLLVAVCAIGAGLLVRRSSKRIARPEQRERWQRALKVESLVVVQEVRRYELRITSVLLRSVGVALLVFMLACGWQGAMGRIRAG